MRKRKRVLSTILVVSMAISCFTGCKKQSVNETVTPATKETVQSKETTEKQPEKRKLKIAIGTKQTDAPQSEVYAWKYLSKLLDIELEFEEVMNLGTALNDYKQLAFATDNLPDIMINMGITTTDIMNYGESEKQIIPLNQYLDNGTMPNLKKLLDEIPETKSVYYTPSGKVYSVGVIKSVTKYDGPMTGGMHDFEVRQSWLEEAKLKAPKTVDDFINMLRIFKKNHPDSIPFGGGYQASSGLGIVMSALGLRYWNDRNKYPFLRPALKGTENEVTFIFGDQELYKPFLEIYNTMYSEGLMSSDYFTSDLETVKAQGAEGKFGVFGGAPPVLIAPDLFMDYWTNEPLTSTYNSEKVWTSPQNYYTNSMAAITSSCKSPSVAAEFLDAFFDKEIALRVAAGPASTDAQEDRYGLDGFYINEKGQRGYLDIDSGKAKNTTDLGEKYIGATQYNLGYYTDNIETTCNVMGVDYNPAEYDVNTLQGRQRQGALDNLVPYYSVGYPTTTYFDETTAARVVDLKTVIEDYAEIQFAKFVTGARPITEEELKQYFSDLDQIGYQEYLSIYSDYYKSIQ